MADFSAIALCSDQLGLSHPEVITVRAQLPNAPAVLLEANSSGLYRPAGYRTTAWNRPDYGELLSSSTGLATGSRVLTARGEIEVERLIPGDAAMALRGPALLPIAWIHKTIAAATLVRIEPGALGPNMPRRPLRLGHDHAVFLKATPVAAHTLVNGTTIRRIEDTDAELFQIDVGHAEVIFAEGLALSSNRGACDGAVWP